MKNKELQVKNCKSRIAKKKNRGFKEFEIVHC
jgi:hypothetical protein